MNWGHFHGENIEKSLTMPKKLKEGPLGFFSIHSVGKYPKIEGGPLMNFFSKSLTEPKSLQFNHFCSTGLDEDLRPLATLKFLNFHDPAL